MNGLDMSELEWFKSRYSSGNGACVECALLPDGGMAVRDTQDRDGSCSPSPPTHGRTRNRAQEVALSVGHT